MDTSTRSDFVRSGLMHIVAVSGYNVTLVAIAVEALLIWMPVIPRTTIVLASIAGFSLLVGDQAPVDRAAVMGCIAYLVFVMGRRVRMMPLLIAVVTLFALRDPVALRYDPSLQLSCLALAGVVVLGPPLVRYFSRIPKTLGIRTSVAITLAATLSTLPVIIVDFGLISIVSPLTNFLVAPVIPFAMLFGFAGIIVYPWWGWGGYMIGYLAHTSLAWIIGVVHIAGSFSFAAINVPLLPYG